MIQLSVGCAPWACTMTSSDFPVLLQVVELPEHPGTAPGTLAVGATICSRFRCNTRPLPRQSLVLQKKSAKILKTRKSPVLDTHPAQTENLPFYMVLTPATKKMCKNTSMGAFPEFPVLTQTSGSADFAAFMDIDGSDANPCEGAVGHQKGKMAMVPDCKDITAVRLSHSQSFSAFCTASRSVRSGRRAVCSSSAAAELFKPARLWRPSMASFTRDQGIGIGSTLEGFGRAPRVTHQTAFTIVRHCTV